jgi:hypothetical protein
MHFDGDVLATILQEQQEQVMVCDHSGAVLERVSGKEAAGKLHSNCRYFGVGHSKRIRYIQPLVAGHLSSVSWRGGSRTTKRVPILNAQGEKISGLLITEHKGSFSGRVHR